MATKLQLSSCLFGTVVLHAYHKREEALHFLSLCVTICSILNHSSVSHSFIRRLDMFFAHVLCAYAAFYLALGLNPLLLLVVIIVGLWFFEMGFSLSLETAENVHAAIHVVAVLGLHSYLIF